MPKKLTEIENQLMERSIQQDCFGEIREIIAEERAVVHYVTTTTADDCYQTVWAPDGFDFGRIEKTRSVFYAHRYRDALPIGGMMWIKPDKRGVLAKTRFARTQMGEDLWMLTQDLMITGWSHGSDPRAWVEKGAKDFDALVKKYGFTGVFDVIFTDALMYEYSSTGVPANPDAINRARALIQDGRLRSELLIRDISERVGDGDSLPPQIETGGGEDIAATIDETKGDPDIEMSKLGAQLGIINRSIKDLRSEISEIRNTMMDLSKNPPVRFDNKKRIESEPPPLKKEDKHKNSTTRKGSPGISASQFQKALDEAVRREVRKHMGKLDD